MTVQPEQFMHEYYQSLINFAKDSVCFQSKVSKLLHVELALNETQSRAYETAVKCICDEQGPQMVMFLTGGSGTGKSALLKTIANKITILRGKSVLKTAPTRTAALNIGGHSWQTALNVSPRKQKVLTTEQIRRLRETSEGLHVFVLDELNFVSAADLGLISSRLCHATGVYDKPFGGLHTILCGDFYQFKPVSGASIGKETDPNSTAPVDELTGRDLFRDNLTHYVILTANTRVSIMSPLARFATQARVGSLSPTLLSELNERVVSSMTAALASAHPEALWISDTYKNAQSINDTFLLKLVREGQSVVRLIAHHEPCSVLTLKPDFATRVKLYATKKTPGCLPVYLDLCKGSRVRLTRNVYRSIGLGVGAMGTVVDFVYRTGTTPPDVLAGMPPNEDFASLCDAERELPIVLIQVDRTNRHFSVSCSNKVSRLVPILPVCDGKRIVVGGCRYHRFQVPLALAHSRACFSTGPTPHEGVVLTGEGKVSPFYAAQYVAVSRVTSMEKLTLLYPLRETHFTGFPDFREEIHAEYARLETEFSQETFAKKF